MVEGWNAWHFDDFDDPAILVSTKYKYICFFFKMHDIYVLIYNALNMQRRIQGTPIFRIFWGVVFVNFNCIICIYFNCSHHTMFTIFTLFSTLTTKHRLRVKGASKQTPDPNNSTMPRLRSPVLKFLDSPLTSMFQKKISM